MDLAGSGEGAADGHQAPRAGAAGQARPLVIVVMGVAGAGKTTVGLALAQSLGCPFHDADDLHPAANVAKMARGLPLTDEDRAPWLAALHALVARLVAERRPAVLACSALKHGYRDALARGLPHGTVAFVHLSLPPALAAERLSARREHFMPASLVASQFAALEPPAPDEALTVDAAQPVAEIVARVRQAIR